MPLRHPAFATLLGFFVSAFASTLLAADPAKQIHSNAPATRWEDAMVVGNGLIGAMHHGTPARQLMAFNSHEFLLPNGSPYELPDLSDLLEPMRDKMLAGDIGGGWRLYHDAMLRRRGIKVERKPYLGMVSSQSFHPGYQLAIDLTLQGETRGYRRSTDYPTGEVVTRWSDDRGDWTSRSFASRADEVLVTEVIAPTPGALNAVLSAAHAPRAPGNVSAEVLVEVLGQETFLNFRGRYPVNHGKHGGYEGVTRVVLDGGAARVDSDKLRIEGATRMLLLTNLDRYHDDYRKWDAKQLQRGLQQVTPSYDQLFARHAAIHREIYDRVTFSLGAGEDDLALPTEELLAKEEADRSALTPALVEKVFYTSRYLFMASSGEHFAPRLCGLFTGAWGAAWSGDYTCDANVNLAVLGGNLLDLPECMEGYFQILERTLPQWRDAAQKYYGCRGILGPVRIDGEIANTIHCGPYHAHCTTTGLGPWLLYPMFEHYLITGDKHFLRDRLHPLLKEQALFYEDFLTRTDNNGHVVFVPSNSPENAWGGVKPRTSASINATMDIAAAKHSLRMLLVAEEELGITSSADAVRAQTLLDKMPPYLITDDGALKEWAWPTIGENYRHRHSSHMYTVWPAYEINPENPGAAHLVPAVVKALENRRTNLVQAHDALQKAAAWQRLKRGDEFYRILKHLMERRYLFTSLATSHDYDHSKYNYDAILCLQGLLAEMCVYTDSGVNEPQIELLPALPEEFRQGRIAGVKGRNRTTIEELRWDLDAGEVHCRLVSAVDQELTLISRRGLESIEGPPAKASPFGDHARKVFLPAGKAVDLIVRF